jgi:predicted DCC family thiol-disulfide oxidoreductase YuxK
MKKGSPILLFDGVCTLCNGAVDFVMKHEKEPVFYFASLQSDFGKSLLTKFNIDANELNTLYVFSNGKLFNKSAAVILVVKTLKSPWNYLKLFSFFPEVILDFFYDIVSKYRYKIFGKKEFCRIPTLIEKERFLG